MKCPFCGSQDTSVIDSRPADDNTSIRRRRSCPECGKRFTTYEKVETIPLIVIKRTITENHTTGLKSRKVFLSHVERDRLLLPRFQR